MKIRAKIDDYSGWLGFHEGDIFEAKISEGGTYYDFIDNDGDNRFVTIDHFEVVNEYYSELKYIIDELNNLRIRAWQFGTYEDVHIWDSEKYALDKVIELLEGIDK